MACSRTLRSCAAAAVAAGLAAPALAGLAPDELFRRLSPSVWRVVTSDAAGRAIATGSAVVVGPGVLVTNCHVLKGAAGVALRSGDRTVAARLLHADTERDLCELSAPVGASAAPLAPGPAQIGQRVYTIGSPRGLDATLSDGLVSGLRRDAAGTLVYIQISAPISPGSSGGGLFDEEGRLLGITSAGVAGDAQNLNFARPAAQIPEIPARSAAALQRWRTGKAAAAEPVAEQRKPAVPVSAPPAPAAAEPARIGTGYAAIDDIDAIPYLSDRGRAGYRDWLGKGTPRAFALAPNGHWASSWGLKPRDPAAPLDPAERAVWSCERLAKVPCRLYAVNTAVVWVRDAAPTGSAPAPEGPAARP